MALPIRLEVESIAILANPGADLPVNVVRGQMRVGTPDPGPSPLLPLASRRRMDVQPPGAARSGAYAPNLPCPAGSKAPVLAVANAVVAGLVTE